MQRPCDYYLAIVGFSKSFLIFVERVLPSSALSLSCFFFFAHFLQSFILLPLRHSCMNKCTALGSKGPFNILFALLFSDSGLFPHFVSYCWVYFLWNFAAAIRGCNSQPMGCPHPLSIPASVMMHDILLILRGTRRGCLDGYHSFLYLLPSNIFPFKWTPSPFQRTE